MIALKQKSIESIIRMALTEDVANGDVTTESLSLTDEPVWGSIISKSEGIICGTNVASEVFREVDDSCRVEILVNEGRMVYAGDVVMRVKGHARALLLAERTALNFLSHMSGISTLTSEYVRIVRGINPQCSVMDTRKTIPGLRALQKYAVITGGGQNHRLDLAQHVLVKENHMSLYGADPAVTVHDIRKNVPKDMIVEVEVEDIGQLISILETEVDIIMLDNFSIKDISKAVRIARKKRSNIMLEASGGVTVSNIADIASTGVDRISMGCLTNSVTAHDYSMLINR